MGRKGTVKNGISDLLGDTKEVADLQAPQAKSNPYECGLGGGFSILGLVCFETRPLLIPVACCLRLAPNPCTFMCIPKYKEHHIMVPPSPLLVKTPKECYKPSNLRFTSNPEPSEKS